MPIPRANLILNAECRRLRAQWPEVLQGDAPARLILTVKAHLTACPACRRDLDGLMEERRRSIPMKAVPPVEAAPRQPSVRVHVSPR
jgi:predicted anti-sigma-YlaC factor YlaD